MPSRQIEDLVRKLETQGWRVKGRKKHFVAFPPDKRYTAVSIAGTPSDHRAYENIVSMCRKRGARV